MENTTAPKFILDYLLYNQGNECPQQYHLWSSIFLLAAAAGPKVHVDLGYMSIKPNLYLGLIGKQGSRKSSAKDIARDMFNEVFPDAPIGAAMQSREDIVKTLSAADSTRAYTDPFEGMVEFHPMTFFINELKNFLSINPAGMIEFLTDIYDRRFFDASTIKHGLQKIERPCINILACETPEWITGKLKLNILTGGWSRRIIYVYVSDEVTRIPFPEVTQESKDARKRCTKHLALVGNLTGKFEWEPDAKEFYAQWYKDMVIPADEIMAGYYQSKHIQLIKVAMALAMGEEVPKLKITKSNVLLGIAFLDSIEVNMPKLSLGAGRNELGVPMQRILDLIEASGGMMPEKILRREAGKDLMPHEYASVIEHLRATDQITNSAETVNGVMRNMVILLKLKDELIRSGKLIVAKKSPVSTPSAPVVSLQPKPG